MLKSLREERKLTMHDIAAKLYLDVNFIEALELNNFSVLPGSTYTRGYLRSYAKIVGADADLIISIYNNVAPGPPEIIPEVKHPTQISSSDKPVRAITWMICLLLALLLLSWLHSYYTMPDDDSTANPAAAVPGDLKQEAAAISGRRPEPVTPGEGLLTDRSNSADIDDDLITPVADPSATGDIVSGGQDEAMDGTGDETAGEENASALPGTESDGGTDIIGVTSSGPDKLKLRLTGDSWVEILDRDGNRLYENLARTGDEISLAGTAPFSVKLGFSQAVSLEFNGEPFDPAPFSRAGVASFTLE